MFSMMTEPPAMMGSCSATTVTTGMGVLDRVAEHHPPLRQALGPGGPHVVLAQHLQHHRAGATIILEM